MVDSLQLHVRTDTGNERFCWGAPDEMEGDWISFSVPAAEMLSVNKMLNQHIVVAALLLQAASSAAYEAGFADDALPADGMITF
jgi:hypothetical protein